MPDLPQPHLPATARTAQRITAERREHPLPIAPWLARHLQHIHRLLHRDVQCQRQLLAHLLQNATRLQALVPYPLKPFWQNMLQHPPDKGRPTHALLGSLPTPLMIAIPVRHRAVFAIIGNDAGERHRRTDHLTKAR